MWWISARSSILHRCSRCARKTGLVKPETGLKFLGFGNDERQGTASRLRPVRAALCACSICFESVNEEMLKRSRRTRRQKENLEISEEEAKETAKMIALAAIKYGDLSNQAKQGLHL